MNDLFGDHARRLAGHCGRLLGWPPHWFWRATPAELAAILSPPDQAPHSLSRADLERLMEHDSHG